MHYKLWFDGSYDWATKMASGGAVLRHHGKDHTFTWDFGTTTMNGSEFMALIHGVAEARKLGATELTIVGDSKLVVKCVNGRWKAKQEHIKAWTRQARNALAGLKFTLTWIPREKNLADEHSRVHRHEPKAELAEIRQRIEADDWLEDAEEFADCRFE